MFCAEAGRPALWGRRSGSGVEAGGRDADAWCFVTCPIAEEGMGFEHSHFGRKRKEKS